MHFFGIILGRPLSTLIEFPTSAIFQCQFPGPIPAFCVAFTSMAPVKLPILVAFDFHVWFNLHPFSAKPTCFWLMKSPMFCWFLADEIASWDGGWVVFRSWYLEEHPTDRKWLVAVVPPLIHRIIHMDCFNSHQGC